MKYTHLCLGIICSSLIGASALAKNYKAKSDNPAIEITSFHSVGASRLAELCGKVSGPQMNYNLLVTSDDRSSNPGNYHTSTGKTSDFCIILYTFTGTARVELE